MLSPQVAVHRGSAPSPGRYPQRPFSRKQTASEHYPDSPLVPLARPVRTNPGTFQLLIRLGHGAHGHSQITC